MLENLIILENIETKKLFTMKSWTIIYFYKKKPND